MVNSAGHSGKPVCPMIREYSLEAANKREQRKPAYMLARAKTSIEIYSNKTHMNENTNIVVIGGSGLIGKKLVNNRI